VSSVSLRGLDPESYLGRSTSPEIRAAVGKFAVFTVRLVGGKLVLRRGAKNLYDVFPSIWIMMPYRPRGRRRGRLQSM